jgi:hypothetical protein
MGFSWLTPINLNLTTLNAWTDVDVSASVPAGATGVILRCINTNTSNFYNIGLRKNGSTDNRPRNIYPGSQFWTMIGVDGGRTFEAFISNIAVDMYLVGYVDGDGVFLTNGVDKSLTAIGAWTDIDISTDTSTDTAIGAVFEVVNTIATGYMFGVRKNGSSDSRYQYVASSGCVAAIIGVDASEVCEGYIENAALDFYLIGYLKAGAIFLTNATDLSLTVTAVWTDLSALPSGATGGFIEVYSSAAYKYDLRENGSAEALLYYKTANRSWVIVKADASQVIEGVIENVAVDFFLVGYAVTSAVEETIYADLLRRVVLSESIPADTLRQTVLSESVPADALRQTTASESIPADTKRRVAVNESIPADTQRQVALTEAVNADTFRQTVLTEAVQADTLRATLLSESILADTLRRVAVYVVVPADTLRPVVRSESVPADTIRRVALDEAVTADTERQTVFSETISADTKRITVVTDTVTADTLRRVGVDETVLADLLRRVALNESVNADTLRRVGVSETIQADTLRRTVLDELVRSDTKRMILVVESVRADTLRQVVFLELVGRTDLRGEYVIGINLLGEYLTGTDLLGEYQIETNLLGKLRAPSDLLAEFNISTDLKGGVIVEENQDFSIVSGDDHLLNFTVTLPVGMTLAMMQQIKWVLYRGRVILTKTVASGITVTGNNTFRVTLAKADTASLEGLYTHEAELTDDAGNVGTIARGKAVIIRDLVN